MHPQTEAVLTKAGWHPQRYADVGPWQRAVVHAGHPWTSQAQALLETYGGLTIRPLVDSDGALFGVTLIDIDPLKAVDFAPEAIRHAAERVGEPLVPIGEVDQHGIQLAGASGIYVDYSFLLHHPGLDIDAALDVLVLRRSKPTVVFTAE